MDDAIRRLRHYGWVAAELGLMVVVLCVLLTILLGPEKETFAADVSNNAVLFLQGLPPGALVALSLLSVVWGYWKGVQNR